MASSIGSGRSKRNSSVCHNNSISSASRRLFSGAFFASSKSAIVASLLKIDLRAASVGCAVKTGRTESDATLLANSSLEIFCSAIRLDARCNHDSPFTRSFANVRAR